MTVMQEFYCNECHGYFRVILNMDLNRTVVVVCPNCGHRHHRVIKNGVVSDPYGGTHHTKYQEEILCPRSCYSKEPLHKLSRAYMREGQVVRDPGDLIGDLWKERFGGRI